MTNRLQLSAGKFSQQVVIAASTCRGESPLPAYSVRNFVQFVRQAAVGSQVQDRER